MEKDEEKKRRSNAATANVDRRTSLLDPWVGLDLWVLLIVAIVVMMKGGRWEWSLRWIRDLKDGPLRRMWGDRITCLRMITHDPKMFQWKSSQHVKGVAAHVSSKITKHTKVLSTVGDSLRCRCIPNYGSDPYPFLLRESQLILNRI